LPKTELGASRATFAIAFARDLPDVGKSDAGVLHVRHPPSQLLADGVVGPLREAAHLFQRVNPFDVSNGPIEFSA